MFSRTFQGNFNFQALFKTVLYIQVLFKHVPTLIYELRHLCMLGSFFMLLLLSADFQNNFFNIFFQAHYESVKQFEFRWDVKPEFPQSDQGLYYYSLQYNIH